MSELSTGSHDRDAPRPTHDQPRGDDPRPGNVGRSGETAAPDGHDDVLDEAADETFPASDPPSWSAAPTLGEERPEPSGAPPQHGLGRVVQEG